jgi:hypothetical protein
MKLRLVVAVIITAATLANCEPVGTIRGSLFIATRGGEGVKLALVKVAAIPAQAAADHLKKKRQEFMSGKERWRTDEGVEQGAANSRDLAKHIFESLPSAAATALTDADGHFTISVPKGSYYLAVKASREIGPAKEDYYWLVEAKATDPPQEVMLSNHNLLNDNLAMLLMAGAAGGFLDAK